MRKHLRKTAALVLALVFILSTFSLAAQAIQGDQESAGHTHDTPAESQDLLSEEPDPEDSEPEETGEPDWYEPSPEAAHNEEILDVEEKIPQTVSEAQDTLGTRVELEDGDTVTVLLASQLEEADEDNVTSYGTVQVLDPFVWVNEDVVEYEDYNAGALEEAMEEIAEVAAAQSVSPRTVSVNQFVTAEEARVQVREYLKLHRREFTIRYKTADNSVKGMYAAAMALFDWAAMKTGDPEGGQYIGSQLYTYGCEITYTKGSDGMYNTTLKVTTTFFSTEEQEAQMRDAIDSLLGEILEPCMSDYQKIRAIWNWMTRNIKYGDPNETVAYSAYAGLVERACVCQGYSALFLRLAMEAGCDAWFVNNGINHAWNMVQLGDYYYNMDVTWGWGFRGSSHFPNHNRIRAWNNPEFHAAYPTSVTDYDPNADISSNVERHEWDEGRMTRVPSCTEDGLVVYTCGVCGKTREEVVPSSVAHSMIHIPARAATENEVGSIEYWYCSSCQTCYADAEGSRSVSLEDTVIAATGHLITYVPASEPDCAHPGHVAYWHCSECDTYFLNQDLTEVMEDPDSAIVPPLGHVLTHTDAKEATCAFPGIIEYWYCSRCRTYFADEACAQPVTTLATRATYHGYDWDTGENDLVYFAPTPAADTEPGNREYWYCPHCGNCYPNSAGVWYTEEDPDAFRIPAGTETEVTVHLTWQDRYGNAVPEHWLPEELELALVCALESGTGAETARATLTKADGWTYTFAGVSGGLDYTISDPAGVYAFTGVHDRDTGILTVQGTLPLEVVFQWSGDEGTGLSCEALFCPDGAGTDPTVRSTCTVTDQVTQVPDCTHSGTRQYKAEVQLDGVTYRTTRDLEIPATGHTQVTLLPLKAPGLGETGRLESWFCEDCRACFLDETCQTETDYDDLTIPALQSLYYVDGTLCTLEYVNEALEWFACRGLSDPVTVVLTQDVTGSLAVPEGTCVTLNLNEKTLTGIAGTDTVHVLPGGSLTVVDQPQAVLRMASLPHMIAAGPVAGRIVAPEGDYAAVYNEGTAALDAGSYESAQGDWYTIVNQGSLEIEREVTVTGGAGACALIANGLDSGARTGASDATLVIHDGTFSAQGDAPILYNAGIAELAGGTFTGTAVSQTESAQIQVAGGTFTDPTVADYIAEGDGVTGLSVSATGLLYVCDTEEADQVVHALLEQAEEAGIPVAAVIVEVLAGDAQLTQLDQVTVLNTGTGAVTADGVQVETSASAHVHDMVLEVLAQEPTCTQPGNIHYWHCGNCGGSFADPDLEQVLDEDSLTIPATGHPEDQVTHVPSAPATEERTGTLEYWHCALCDGRYLDAELTRETSESELILVPIGHEHTLVSVPTQEPTCSQPGHSAYWHCPDCGKYFADAAGDREISLASTVLPAVGHTVAVDPAEAATCLEEGRTMGSHCSVCQEVLTPQESLPRLDHDLVHVPGTPADCREAGTLEHWTCTACGSCFLDEEGTREISRDEVTLPDLGHRMTFTPEQEPTCREDGHLEYWSCDRCGHTFLDEAGTQYADPRIPATGHPQAVFLSAAEPTCLEDGYATDVWYCPDCGIYCEDPGMELELAGEDVVLPATGHRLVYLPGSEPTAEQTGSLEFWYCPDCDTRFGDADATRILTPEDILLQPLGTREEKEELPEDIRETLSDLVTGLEDKLGTFPDANPDYTQGSWERLLIAYHEAVSLLSGEETENGNAQSALDALREAIQGLTRRDGTADPDLGALVTERAAAGQTGVSTGDHALPVALLIVILVLAAAGLILLAVTRSRRNRHGRRER